VPAQGQCQFTTVNNVKVITRTSKDPETLASIAPIGIAMAEAAQQSLEVYLRLRGRVAERRGPIVLSGTFEGSLGWYPELWQRWQADNPDEGRSFSIPTWSNRAIYPGGRQDPEILELERITPADLFMERYGAVPCKPATLVFKEFGYLTHVRDLPFLPGQSVQLWIDPGYAGAYAVLAVQFDRSTIPATVRHFDEVYRQGATSPDIIDECKARPWWGSVRTVVMDVAGRQHHAQESHFETWRRLAGLVPMGQPVGIADGIERHRTFLVDPASGKPRLLHDPRCKGTLAEYGKYKYHDIKENRPTREEPIDVDNHAMKAIAYGLVHNFGFVTSASTQPPKINVRVRA